MLILGGGLLGLLFSLRTFVVASRSRLEVDFESTLAEVNASIVSHDASKRGQMSEVSEADVTVGESLSLLRDIHSRLKSLDRVEQVVLTRRQALLETYHKTGLLHSNVSFWFSIALAVAGFLVILYSVLTRSEQIATYASGAVVEAVAGLIFKLSTEARQTMMTFFDRARDDSRLAEALAMADRLHDPQMKAAVQAVMALELMGSKTSADVLPGMGREASKVSPTPD